MLKAIVIIFWCLIVNKVVAQNTITGTVINADTEQAITNANVFITNTSRGTKSDTLGKFVLDNVPIGTYEIVVSCIGYATITYTYKAAQLPLRLQFKLNIKVQKEEIVTVRPYEKNGWEKWGTVFLESYLGKTENSLHCKLENPENVRFRMDKKRNVLEVYATDMLLIKNKKLGYIIKNQLEAFEIDFNKQMVINLGYPYFETIETKTNRKQRLYEKARKRAYYGSIMHFIRCLYKDSITTQGFVMKDYNRIKNVEKIRVKEIIRKKFMAEQQSGNSITLNQNGISNTIGDSSSYYNKVMQQPDMYDVLGGVLSVKDIVFKDSIFPNHKLVTFPNWLQIEYKLEAQEERYYNTQFVKQKYAYQTTKIFFRDEKMRKIYIDKNGNYFDPLSIFLEGYMGWEKMADMLPFDYEVTD